MTTTLITGAKGFIGGAYARNWAAEYNNGKRPGQKLIALARYSSQWAMERLENHFQVQEAIKGGGIKIHYVDLTGDISGVTEGIDTVIHFAAKTFVDHSIRDPKPFFQSNTQATSNLLEDAARHGVKKFIHISTDEVYGQILEGSYDENAPINPRNPYAASKAAADALTISYFHTYGMWTAVTRTENNYGPYQHPQKALPVFISKALQGKPIPVYGDGQHVRQWLYVDDHVTAIDTLLAKSDDLPGGEVYHIAGNQETTNHQLAMQVIDKVQTALGRNTGTKIELIDDHNIRPGHDRRYALSCQKMHKIGWKPSIDLERGLEILVDWYIHNQQWQA